MLATRLNIDVANNAPLRCQDKFDSMAKIHVFPDRKTLFAVLPKGTIGAELGVQRGENAFDLLEVAKPKKLHLIDKWESPAKWKNTQKRFAHLPEVVLHRRFTQEIVTLFENEYFDWIYIDADHAYRAVLRDLRLYHSKVKKDGLVFGHDFFNHGEVKMDVIKAVLECVAKGLYQFLYLTKDRWPSYGLRRI